MPPVPERKKVVLAEVKHCDLCKDQGEKFVMARYDARVVRHPVYRGQWGYLCEKHFKMFGPHKLGTGYGQELTYTESALVRELHNIEARIG